MRRNAVLIGGMAVLLVAGCGESDAPLRVGSKDFTEALILGEIIAQVAESEDIPVDRSIPYGGTFDNIEALKRGDIDVYPEYNGTALILVGQAPISDGDESYTRVQELYEPLGLVWGRRFGFHNDYEIVMRSDRAAELGIETISDLARIEGEVRFGIDDEFMARPVDGYSAMLRRYGLSGTAAVVEEDTAEGKANLYDALLEETVDVVEGFTTDGQIAEYGLLVLEDDLGFFPTYQPAPLVRDEARRRFAALMPALEQIAGDISVEDMRAMNAAVELDGQDHRMVARRFLAEQDVIEGEEELLVAEELRVAVGDLDAPSGQTATALSAVRKTFSGRNVVAQRRADPMAALLAGEARIALVSAPAFYEMTEGVFPQPREGAEAVGVVGFDLAYVIVPRAGDVRSIGDVSRLGVGAAGGLSARTAEMVLRSLGLDDIELVSASGDDAVEAQIAALEAGDLDALFLMAAEGHPRIAELMSDGNLRLLSLPEWQEGNHLVRFPFLRVSRIGAGTYEGQPQPVDTIGAQVVLAGPSGAVDPVGTAGPGSAAVGEVQRLADRNIANLNENLESEEKLDPALPSAAILRPQPKPAPASINPSPWRSIVNFVVICVMIVLFYLYFRREPPARRREAAAAAAKRDRAA